MFVIQFLAQYRMHPKISAFPSLMFYDSKLRNGPNVTGTDHYKEYHKMKVFSPLVFYDVKYSAESTDDRSSLISSVGLRGKSLMNRVEVDFISNLLFFFYDNYCVCTL